MSEWHQRNQGFVWARVDDAAFLLSRFNQSRSGVFILHEGSGYYKYSLHRDGRAHNPAPKLGDAAPPASFHLNVAKDRF
jgi:hypothetical protein